MNFDFGRAIFNRDIAIPPETKVIFVSDLFVKDYVGGAELTSQALIDSCPFPIFQLHAKDVTIDVLSKNADKFWIFGNFSQMNLELIPSIVGNGLKYAICEYDYKYCKYRSPEKHASIEGRACDCHNDMHGKMVSAFFYGAKSLWWMSEKQRDRYHQMFPFLDERDNTVLSSVFDDKFFVHVKLLREQFKDVERKGWIVLGSQSWVKGHDAALKWCQDNGKEYEVVWNLPYEQLLEKLAQAEGFVYLPAGGDTCPRMVIEAKLLGCQLHLNENVQHKDEEWFATEDRDDTESYLYLSRSRFWAGIRGNMEYKPTLSGYTTTYNCVSQGYPFEQSIKSMLEFCDEVVVVDGGSNDGTIDRLRSMMGEFEISPDEMKSADGRLRVKIIKRDWNHPRFAVFDGLQKAEARKLCTKDFCWQQDSDEVVNPSDAPKIRDLIGRFPPGMKLLALPVVEYWGGADKVRMDVNPWKWRVSRNDTNITHGIPAHLRKTDKDGNLYADLGTDGCDYIHAETGQPIPFGTFYTHDIDQLRHAAFVHPQAREQYEHWVKNVVDNLPTVFHFSWWNLERKIKTYRGYWGKHWKSLFDIEIVDTPENNMMFDKAWKDVTDEDIKERAKLMKEKLGGWVWHRKWDGKTETPYISVPRPYPESMKEWCSS